MNPETGRAPATCRRPGISRPTVRQHDIGRGAGLSQYLSERALPYPAYQRIVGRVGQEDQRQRERPPPRPRRPCRPCCPTRSPAPPKPARRDQGAARPAAAGRAQRRHRPPRAACGERSPHDDTRLITTCGPRRSSDHLCRPLRMYTGVPGVGTSVWKNEARRIGIRTQPWEAGRRGTWVSPWIA
jgi:hypothetical protein